MQTPDPASVLLRQDVVFADIDQVLDGQPPDFSDQLPSVARHLSHEWLTGPFQTLGRQLLRPPADCAGGERVDRKAAYLLRLAHEVAADERVTNPYDLDEEL